MSIPAKIRPHVEQALREIEESETDGEMIYAILRLAAKLKFHDDGRNIDRLTDQELYKLIEHWLDGNDQDELSEYFDLAVDYIIELIEEIED